MELTDTDYKLWCLVEGDDKLFAVNALPSISIHELKKKIKEMGKNGVLSSVDTKDLILWRVDLAFPSKDNRKHLIGKKERSVGLEETDDLSDHSPATTPPNHKHLKHYLSFLGKPSRAADDPKPTDLPWLEELHSKIWGRGGLKQGLFQDAEVTRTHFNELQDRLRELHRDRDSPGYDGTKADVRSIKLDFLRSLTSAGVSAFWTYQVLKLESEVPDRLPLPLLLRQEYKVISELIKEQPQNSAGWVVVSGQPGAGKTVYLYLRIWHKSKMDEANE
ncbi:hypothetical protein BJV74DRAFT_880612 [Russula compacta]|nr:hypothetical protein BJV74DRAFT_880612 [Russula compacta]